MKQHASNEGIRLKNWSTGEVLYDKLHSTSNVKALNCRLTICTANHMNTVKEEKPIRIGNAEKYYEQGPDAGPGNSDVKEIAPDFAKEWTRRQELSQASEVNGNVGHLLFFVDGCGRSFTSATGLGQYMRHQHPIVHNEKFAGVKRTRWKDDELRRVAHFETECGDLVNVNQYIASKLPGRTGEAVKKVRKRHDYLEILEDGVVGQLTVVPIWYLLQIKGLDTIVPLNATQLMEQIEDGDEALFRSRPEISVPQFEGATLEAKSFRTTALLAVEGKISVDTLFREFSDRYLKGAREESMTGGRGRGGGRSGNRQEPANETKAKRRVRKERPAEKRFRLAQAMFNRSETDCLDAILSVNGFEREEVSLTSTEKEALFSEYKGLFESDPLEDKEGFVPSATKLRTELTCPISPEEAARDEKRSIAILAIDLAKAFDSVQHTSVQRALNRFSASDHLCRVVDDLYTDVDTRLSVGRTQLGHIIMRNGAKQGDPLSPFLFNLVIDEFPTTVNSDPTVTQGIGFQYGGVKVAALGYADDLLLIAETRHGAQLLMDGLTTFCRKRHLRINPSKCQSLCLEWQGKAKSHKVLGSIVSVLGDREQESSLGEGSVRVPAVSVTGSLSYLGTQIRPDGNCEVKESEFASSLAKLRRAPLKGAQKIRLAKLLVQRQFYHVSVADLNMKRIERDGGLGLPCIFEKVPKGSVAQASDLIGLVDHCTGTDPVGTKIAAPDRKI
ncbi:hypothetical protein QYM36_019505 [Artemia franciscana]|uniref:Reverse transcriptase domain-containing protein n=1 Tax=Artemia franciscana TaxID=6661 RepID=A0AA88H565_ARTSF|nr:hypothetical protein QYM36_019505 [Artemia franciscana]